MSGSFSRPRTGNYSLRKHVDAAAAVPLPRAIHGKPRTTIALSPLALGTVVVAGDGCRPAEGTVHKETPCAVPGVVGKGNSGNYLKLVEKARRGVLPLSAKVLAVGMTDTQVLNLPSCGLLLALRAVEKWVWREEWTYQARSSGNDERVVYFKNGRLLKEVRLPPPDPIEAQASTQ